MRRAVRTPVDPPPQAPRSWTEVEKREQLLLSIAVTRAHKRAKERWGRRRALRRGVQREPHVLLVKDRPTWNPCTNGVVRTSDIPAATRTVRAFGFAHAKSYPIFTSVAWDFKDVGWRWRSRWRSVLALWGRSAPADAHCAARRDPVSVPCEASRGHCCATRGMWPGGAPPAAAASSSSTTLSPSGDTLHLWPSSG